MTMSPDGFSNGSAKGDDRFANQLNANQLSANQLGAYRQGSRRDIGRTGVGDQLGDEASPRSISPLDTATPISILSGPRRSSEAPLREVEPLPVPTFARDTFAEVGAPAMADHPLLRGLLMELPAKGSAPTPEWLDRWFEATRSILDLLYSMDSRSS